MLTIFGSRESSSFCDGLRRRDFIRIGSLSMGGLMSLSLADLFRAEARAGYAVVAQGGHQYLPGRRSAAPGHVGHQDRGSRGDPRRVQADRHQRRRASRSARSSRSSRA